MELNQDFSGLFNTNSSGAGQKPTAAPATPSAAPSGLTQDFSSVFAPQQQPQTTNAANTAKLDDVLASEGATALKPLVSAFYGQETSSGANAKTSVDGAQGPMQIMAATGAPYLKPGENLQANGLAVGTRILADYAKRYDNDPAKIAVAYFSGPGNVAASGPTPWKQDKADGNGTTVSQYVKGILTKLGSAAPVAQPAAAPQAQPDQPAAPDLSQAPKWSDVVANPQFQKLDPAVQQQTADAYFAKWIAPNTPAGQLPAAQAEWAEKSAAAVKQATPPSLLSRIGSGIQSAATSLVNNGFATDGTTPDNPAAQNAAVAQAPQQPNTAGVLGVNNTPAAVAAAQKNLPPLPAMASPAMQQQVFQQFDAASPEQRQQMMQQPGVAGQLAQYRAAQYQNNTNPVSSDIGTSAEDRTQRLVNAGVDPAVARAQAQRDAASGAQTMIPGDMKATDFDFDTAARYRNANPIVRGAVQGVAGSAQSLIGIGRFVTDMTGGSNSNVADWLGNASKNIAGTSNAIGQSANPLSRNLEAATSGLVQAVPALLGAAAVPEAAALPLAQNGLQMFGQAYAEGRDAGQDPAQATTRAGMMGAFAVLGHALGLDSKLDAIRQSVAGASTDAIGTSLWNATIRDLPSTQAMVLGNFITDKLPGGVGLTPEAKFTDWLRQAGDMFVQTAMMNGMLGAGAIGGAPLSRTLRGEVKPTFDESSGTISDKNGNYWNVAPNTAPAPVLGAPGTSANAPHPSQVAADNAVREIAATHGMDASALIPEPTPVPQPAAASVAPPAAEAQPQITPQPGQPLVWRNADTDIPVVYRGVAPDRGPDGRLYAQVEHNGTQSFVPFDELAPATAAAPMQASSAEPPAAQAPQAPAVPDLNQQILEFAAQRRDALQAKQNGSLTPTLTPEGHEDVEQPGQQLTPTERAEWDVLTKHANDPATIARFYGLQDDEPAPAGEPAASTPEQVDAAAHLAATSPKNDLPEPTQAQKEAGNYQKGHVDIHGLDVSIENPQGSKRNGTDPDGVVWENTLQDHYGYIRRTVGADDEHIDTFVGPNPASRKVFIVDQTAPDTGKFDEHKVMLGYDSMAEADAAYHRNYMDGWNGRGAISELPIGMFKEWLANGDTKAPFARLATPSTRSAGAKPKTEKEARAAKSVPPVPADMVRMYHGGEPAPDYKGPLWFSSNEQYARDWAAKNGRVARTWYVDVPAEHPILATDYPEQHASRGYTTNRELPADLSSQRKLLPNVAPATPPKTEREARARKQEKADGTTQAQDGAGTREARQEAPGADRTVAGTESAVDRPAAAAGSERGTGGRSASDTARAGRRVQPGAAGSGRDAVAGDVKPKTELEARRARVTAEMDKIAAAAEARKASGNADGLPVPSGYDHGFRESVLDWMTEAERGRFHALKLELPTPGEEREAAADRIAAKVATRKAAAIEAVEPQPKPRTEAQIAAAKKRAREQNTVDPARDSLITAIAKLGGINKAEVMRQWGYGANDLKGYRVGIKPVTTKNGLTIERMGEALHELGYLQSDEHGRYDNRELEEHFSNGLGGSHHFTPEGYATHAAAEAATEYELHHQGLTGHDVEASGFDRLPEEAQQHVEAYLDQYPEISEAEAEHFGALASVDGAHAGLEPHADAADAGHRRDGETREGARGEEEPFSLTAESPDETRARIAREEAQRTGDERALKEADKKAKIDAQSKDFVLTGSDRDADQAAARGQQGLHFSLATPDDGARFAAEYLTELAAHDDLFRHPISKARDLVGIMRDVVPHATYVGDVTAPDERAESGADQKLLFRTAKGHDFNVYETPKKVWLDVSRLDEGEQGSAIYSAVANYAHNTKRVFTGDPAGLSDVALRRRTDNMLSSALKFGTTDHLEPHERQTAGAEKLGVPALSWRAGDDLHNIRSMIDVSLKSFYHDHPEAKNVRYDFDRRAFRIGEGEPVSDGALDQWRVSQGGDRAAGPGHATLKRNVFLDSLARSESAERPQLLERVLSELRQRVLGQDLRGTFYDAGEHPRLDASTFARESALSARPEPDRTSALTTLRRLSKRLDAGEITDAEFRLGAQNLLTKLEDKRDGQLDRKADRTRVRGDLYIRERLLRAERQGDITHAGSQFAQWLLDKNPAIADDLGIGVRGAKDGEGGTAGMYNSINRVVTLISGNTNDGTAVHEILHHTERMMPADIRSAIYKAWARDWQDAYKNATPEQKPFFAAMLKAAVGSQSAWADVAKGFKDGVLKYDEHYKLVNPSEYWAVKATDLMKSRYDAQGWIARAKQWLSEMIQKVKSIFGLPSDAPIIDGLKSVLKGEGEFTTDRMMAEKAPAESHDPTDEVALHAIFHDLAKTPTERADDSYERARTIIDKSFDTKSSAKTFNWLEKTFASQVHKAIKDPEFGRVFNAMRRMMNHTGLAATRAAEKAPMIVPHSDNFRQSVKTLFAGKRQSKEVALATRALLDGTLAGDTVLHGKVWSEQELRQNYGMGDEGVKAYQQTRDAIDTSLDEVSAAEAFSMVHGLVPPEMREQITNEPTKAQSLIRGSLDKKIDMFRKAHDKSVERGDTQKAEILHSLMMPYVETRKKVDDIFEKSELMKSSGYLPLMRFGKYTVYAHKIDPETGLSARSDETGQPLVHYFGMFPTEAEAKHEHEKQLALYKDDPDVKVSRGVKSEKAHQLYEGLSPETLSLFADKVGADTAMQTVIQLALSERSALKRRLGRRAITGFSEDLPRILSNFLTSNGRFAAQRFYMRDVNRAIQEIPKEKGDVMDEAIKLKQFVLNGDDPGSRTMAGMFLWTMAGSPVSAAVVASEPFQKIFPYLSQFGVGQATKALGKALAYVAGRKQITDPELRAAMQRAAREGIIKPQEIFHLYDLGMQNMSTWLSSQLAAHSGPGAAVTKSVADGIRARATAMSTMLGMMHSAAETFGRKMAFHSAWEVAKARGEKDPYAWTVRAIDEAGSQFGKINRANIERTYAGRMMLAYKSFTLGWLGLLFRMARKGGVEGARGVAVMLLTQMAMGGLAGLPFMKNIDDLVDTIGNAMGHNTDFARVKRHWAEKSFGKAFGDTLMHGLARHLPVDLSEHFGMGDIIPGTDLLKAENAKDKARNVLNVLGPQTQFITRIMDAYDAAASGNYVKAGVAMAPNFIKRPMQGAAMLATGQSTDTQGRKVADASTFDALAKMAGGATAQTNEQMEMRNEVRQAVATVQDKQSQIINMWARGIAQGDPDAIQKAQDTLQQWNSNNPGSRIVVTPQALTAQVKQMRLDANTRAIMSAPKGVKGDAVETLRGGNDE
jgi:hypothetical protein